MFHKVPVKAPAILPLVPRITPNNNPVDVDDVVRHFRAVFGVDGLLFRDLVRIHLPRNLMDQPDLDGRVGAKVITVVELPVGFGVDLEVEVDKPSPSPRVFIIFFLFLVTSPIHIHAWSFFWFFGFLFLFVFFFFLSGISIYGDTGCSAIFFYTYPLLSFPRYRRLDEMAGFPWMSADCTYHPRLVPSTMAYFVIVFLFYGIFLDYLGSIANTFNSSEYPYSTWMLRNTIHLRVRVGELQVHRLDQIYLWFTPDNSEIQVLTMSSCWRIPRWVFCWKYYLFTPIYSE